jgi:hypothetical protein
MYEVRIFLEGNFEEAAFIERFNTLEWAYNYINQFNDCKHEIKQIKRRTNK